MTLSQAADVAAIILIAETMAFGLIPFLILYWITQRAAQLLLRTQSWLRTARAWALRAGDVVSALMYLLLAPLLFFSGLRAGLRGGVAAWRRSGSER